MWSMSHFGANVWIRRIGNAEDVCENFVKAAASYGVEILLCDGAVWRVLKTNTSLEGWKGG